MLETKDLDRVKIALYLLSPPLDGSQEEQPALSPSPAKEGSALTPVLHQFSSCALGLLLQHSKRKKPFEPVLSVRLLQLTEATGWGKGLSAPAPLMVKEKVSWRRKG